MGLILLLFVLTSKTIIVADTENSRGLILAETDIYVEQSDESEILETVQKDEILLIENNDESAEDWHQVIINDDLSGYIHKDNIELINTQQETLTGYSINSKVYASPSKDSTILKEYPKGKLLYYKTFTSEWYEALVYINGEPTTGYIHKEDIEYPVENQESLSGIAVKDRTQVFGEPIKSSKALKGYSKGKTLYFKTFLDEWYEALVYVNGQAQTGYIHVDDVEIPTNDPKLLQGVATASSTKVFSLPSKNSHSLKSYQKGSVLYYETYINGWHKAIVYINGDKRTGYISASDVEEPTNNPINLSGIALKSSTNVYSNLNESSKVLKSYSQGTRLYYQTYINGWYKALVYVNGKATTGYIKASDVEEPVKNQESLKGIAVKSHVHVYDKPGNQANILKSYSQGKLLYYKTYLSGWHEALVYVNGKATTGYIKAGDVEEPVQNQEDLKGYAYNSKVYVYKTPSKKSGSLKSYNEGKLLYYKTYLNDWYEALVFVNGKATTGYIHKSDVIDENAEQKTLEGYANKDRVYVYENTSKSSKKLKGYDFNSKLLFKSFTRNWYEAVVFVNGERRTGYISKGDISSNKFEYKSIVNPKTKYSYNQMVSDIKQLEQTYPNLISTEVIGKSVDGRDIHAVKIGNGSNKTLVTASIHSREWITTNLVMEQIDSYAQAYMKGNSISGVNVRNTLDQVTLHFIPMVNPDGVTLVQQGAYALGNTSELLKINNGSNDFKHWKANSRGVDLNRNFSVGWDNASSHPSKPSSQFYKGPKPNSEPETRALVNYANKHNFNGAISYHSSGELIYWDGSAKGSNFIETQRIANIAGNKTGYSVIREIDQYLGHFSDWFAYHVETPLITPELSPSVGNRPVPLSNYDAIWKQNDTLPLIIANELK